MSFSQYKWTAVGKIIDMHQSPSGSGSFGLFANYETLRKACPCEIKVNYSYTYGDEFLRIPKLLTRAGLCPPDLQVH